jgi:DNA-binding transcriptional regulator LsrR (DeoR family)
MTRRRDVPRGRPPKVDAGVRSTIAQLYLSRTAKQAELAKKFGLSQPTVSRIVTES